MIAISLVRRPAEPMMFSGRDIETLVHRSGSLYSSTTELVSWQYRVGNPGSRGAGGLQSSSTIPPGFSGDQSQPSTRSKSPTSRVETSTCEASPTVIGSGDSAVPTYSTRFSAPTWRINVPVTGRVGWDHQSHSGSDAKSGWKPSPIGTCVCRASTYKGGSTSSRTPKVHNPSGAKHGRPRLPSGPIEPSTRNVSPPRVSTRKRAANCPAESTLSAAGSGDATETDDESGLAVWPGAIDEARHRDDEDQDDRGGRREADECWRPRCGHALGSRLDPGQHAGQQFVTSPVAAGRNAGGTSVELVAQLIVEVGHDSRSSSARSALRARLSRHFTVPDGMPSHAPISRTP